MAVNKLALIRYKTIDECLKNRYRKWTLEGLIERVSDALYEYEGIVSGVSKRTIQGDIQLMRSDKLGYNAPIIVKDKKFYTYEDPDYSITNSPINTHDLEKMKEAVSILKHLNGFHYFDEMSDIITKLEDRYHKSAENQNYLLQFEQNKLLKGLELINPIYQAILKRVPLLVEYKSFKAKEGKKDIYHPYLLKEYRNRWFLICKCDKKIQLMTLALDRMESMNLLSGFEFQQYDGVNFERYFEDTIGVTKSEKDRAQKVILWVNINHAPYVLTKPLHHSQQLITEKEDGIVIRIDVVLNFELEREILGFGECMKVLGPRLLANRIKKRAKAMNEMYFPGDK